jgi:hypothetical protein
MLHRLADSVEVAMDVIYARTDRTLACRDCAVRLWRTTRCPRCGEQRSLVDVASPAARPTPRELLPGPAFLSRKPKVVARGRARAVGPLLRAPLSGRSCLAWVIEAELPSTRVLDASGSRFEVVDESRTWVVEGSTGGYVLDADAAPWLGACPRPAPGALATFLAERGSPEAELPGTSFVERVLAPGAHVEVAGIQVASEPASSGYRGGESTQVLGDARGAPLRVTLIASAPRER